MADKLLKSIKFPTLPDRYVIGDSTLTEAGAAAEAKAVGDALATKADTSGTYEDLIVGGAEQLMADEYEIDKEPYLFRTTGGSADVGNREYLDKIVGGTVAWNQSIDPSDTFSVNSADTLQSSTDGVVTVKQGAVTVNHYVNCPKDKIVGHVYLAVADINAETSATSLVARYMYSGVASAQTKTYTANKWSRVELMAKMTATSGSNYLYYDVGGKLVTDDIVTVKNYQVIDLTALFNTTIADYIYNLEQSQAGAGVAWFRNYFPKDYYPYDPGTLRSVEGVSAHETVGFNQWDEEWESGTYLNLSGAKYPSSTKIRNVNPIKVFPGTAYYWHVGSTSTDEDSIFCYDADMNFIQRFSFSHGTTLNIAFTTPSNCEYINLSINNTTYNHDICINLSDPTRNGEYEPYQKHTYPLDSSLTLRGTPKLADGKLEFDGDIYPPSGEVQRRYNEATITDSMVTMVGASYSDVVYAEVHVPSDGKQEYTKGGMLTKYGVAQSQSGTWDSATHVGNFYMNAARDTFWVGFAHGTSLADMKTALVGMTLLYELATPTTETADGYEQYQICDPSGTEEFVTDSIVPVGHETRYPHDLKKKIETAPDSPSTDGTYLMKRSGGKNAYMALPSTPSANGAYVLTVTVSGGSASYSWTKKE